MTFAQPFSDYEILDRVGAGAMGTVFKARQKRLSRIVALKVLRPSLARDTRYVERLRREARIVGGLNHPNIVTGYDLGEEGGYHFFVMEFVEGKSLRALLSEWGSFSEEQVLKVGIQVARALDHAFQRGVIHRDVKPANILIDEQGNVKLTDMGLAKGPADLTLTRDGATVGTPQYISPEQARNPQDVDVRSDLYSLGATLYHMATGQPPFRGDSLAEVITKVLHEVPVAPRVLDPSLSEGLSLVIRKLLTKNLRLRYQTPAELLLDLERVAQSKPPQVDEQRLLQAEEPGRGRLWPWLVGLGGAAAIAAGAFWYGITLRHEGPITPSGDAFLLGLADDLAGVKSLRDQWQLLQAAGLRAPPGSVQGIEAQKQKVALELARAVNAAMAGLQGEQWPATLTWLADPLRWPSLIDFERERISRALVDRTGFLAEQLPPSVDTSSIAALRAAVDQAIAARDQSLLTLARSYLTTTLPVRAAERSANGDFKAAEKIWREGLLTFFDGRQQPKLERVSESVRSLVVQTFEDQRKVAMRELDAQETAAAAALRRDAETFTTQLRDRLAAGSEPAVLLTDLDRLRDELGQSYPSASRFRSDPWVDVKRGIDACERSLVAAAADFARRRQARSFDLAWRVFCVGDPEAAAGMLPAPLDAAKEPLIEQHRQALTAGAMVAAAMTRALLQRPPVPGHPRDSGLVVELTAVAQPSGAQLLASTASGTPRVAHVTEFRFADLWREVMQVDPKALLGLPREQRELGQAVLAMVSDALAEGGPLAAAPTPFLRDEVYERIVRMRGDGGVVVTAQGEAMRRLTAAYDRARQIGDTRDLDAALLLFERSPADSIPADDRTTLQAIRQWREAERQRQQRLIDVQGSAPKGARIDVASEAGVLVATVQVEGAQVAAGASDNWAFNGRTVEFTGSGTMKFEGMVSSRLELGSGLPAAARRVDCSIDLVLPPPSIGPRSYVFDFRGVAVLLLVTADDKVRAAVVDGDPRQEEPVHAASLRALSAALDNGTHGRVIPGAMHRLQVRVDANTNRTRGAARILFDQAELCLDEDVVLDPMRPPNLTIYPLQAMQLRAVQFSARGF